MLIVVIVLPLLQALHHIHSYITVHVLFTPPPQHDEFSAVQDPSHASIKSALRTWALTFPPVGLPVTLVKPEARSCERWCHLIIPAFLCTCQRDEHSKYATHSNNDHNLGI